MLWKGELTRDLYTYPGIGRKSNFLSEINDLVGNDRYRVFELLTSEIVSGDSDVNNFYPFRLRLS